MEANPDITSISTLELEPGITRLDGEPLNISRSSRAIRPWCGDTTDYDTALNCIAYCERSKSTDQQQA